LPISRATTQHTTWKDRINTSLLYFRRNLCKLARKKYNLQQQPSRSSAKKLVSFKVNRIVISKQLFATSRTKP
jgi:hypothetical protein